MQDILRMALVAAQAVAAANPPQPRARPYCIVGGVAGILLCLLTASGLVTAAAWLFLLPHLGPVGPPLVLAGIMLIIATAILVWLRLRASPPAPAAPLAVSVADLVPIVAPLLTEAERLFRANKLTTLTAALLAGLTVGARRG